MDPTVYRSHITTTTATNNNGPQLREPWFYNSPQARESEGLLITTAATAANERRRDQKTIMNCFRDRTPSYTRSNSHIARANGGLLLPRQQQPQQQQHPGLGPIARDRPRPINLNLTLLKSSSTRDISRLVELDDSPPLPPSSSSSTDLTKMTSSSSLSSSTSTNCSGSCLRHIQRLEQRINDLETQLNQQQTSSVDMAVKVEELKKKMDLLTKENEAQNKRKKSASPRSAKKESTSGGGGGVPVQPSKLVTWMKLSNFWKQRPSIQTLKDQNIYNDEPCFDTEIEMVLKDDVHNTVPKIVVDCCQLIEEKYRKSTEPIEGIYRQCGDYNKMQALRFSIDANDYNALRQTNVDIHTLAGVLKLFLREIKSPLVSANEAKTFIGKPNQWVLTDLPNKLEILRRLIRSLPEVNRDTMEYLFSHFNKLTKVPLQHISAETLAISITPSIFHTVQQGARMQDIHALLKESEILADCVKIMIEYHQKIFECTDDRKHQKHRISVRNLKKTLSHPDLLFQNLF